MIHKSFHTLIVVAALVLPASGCATYWQARRVDERTKDLDAKLDRLLDNTRRSTLSEIFGAQTTEISARLEGLSQDDRQSFERLMAEYQRGASTLEEVRAGMISMLGGGRREVSASRGIWVRDMNGTKLKAISRNTAIENCAKLSDDEIPAAIRDKAALMQFSWGRGELDGTPIIFPWELTLSSFARDIVENTARRTAEEVMKMAGESGWNRPIRIQVSTDPSGKGLKISTPGAENEIYITNENDK